jgi:hypothetical protein
VNQSEDSVMTWHGFGEMTSAACAPARAVWKIACSKKNSMNAEAKEEE